MRTSNFRSLHEVVKSRRFWGTEAAGAVLQRKSDGKVLLLHRSNVDGDGWGFPGGKIDDGDNAKSCVIQEIKEELGSVPKGRFTGSKYVYTTPMNAGDYIVNKGTYVKDGDHIDFSYTFLHYLIDDAEWKLRMNWEHDDHGWFDLDDLPKGLYIAIDDDGKKVHTVRVAINRLCKPISESFALSFIDFCDVKD